MSFSFVSVTRMTKLCTVTLAKFGLEQHAACLVANSPLIAEMENQNRVHPAFKVGMYEKFRHWVVTFHDETLEVVALRAELVGTSQLPPHQAVCEPEVVSRVSHSKRPGKPAYVPSSHWNEPFGFATLQELVG